MIAALHQDQYNGINDKMMFLARDHDRLHDAPPFARSSEKKMTLTLHLRGGFRVKITFRAAGLVSQKGWERG